MGGKKKVAYQLTVDVYESNIKDFVREVEQYLLDAHGLKVKVKNNEAVLAVIRDGVIKHLEFAMQDYYAEDVVDMERVEKLFEREIEEAEAKYEAEQAAQEEREYAERQATAGVLRMHPSKLAEAKKLLKAAGIEVSM